MAGTFAKSSDAGLVAGSPSVAPTIFGAGDVVNFSREAIALQTDALIVRALQDADKFHRGQNRQWKEEFHIRHVQRVVSRVMLFPDVTTPEVTGSSWHDVAEMCCRDLQAQESVFHLHEDRYGRQSMEIVRGLTNASCFSKLPRTERKRIDFACLGKQPVNIKRIKAVDRIDNLAETVLDLMSGIGASPRFALLYADESEALAAALSGIDLELISELKGLILEVRRVASTVMESQT